MKKILNFILIVCILGGAASCEYLDIVPDEKPTEEDAFQDQEAAERFLYSCYGYLPKPRWASSSLDFLTGDEVITASEHEKFANFPKGNYTSTNPIISYWNTLFAGIRQCYIFKENLSKVPNLSDELSKDYLGQADFLIGYYHFLLMRCYGPTILIKEMPDINVKAEDFLGRSPYDECVEFVARKFDEAALGMPTRRDGNEFGLVTSVAAKAMKARLLLFAASPLFNGNPMYANFKDKEGNALMSANYDAKKWELARDAAVEAIKLAEEAGHSLYNNSGYGNNGYPANQTLRTLRYNIIEPANSEIIWADARKEGPYGLQNKCHPYVSGAAFNGVGPTMAMLNRFYTKNGLPISEDPEYDYADRFKVVTVQLKDEHYAMPGKKTVAFNLNREPRFYAWVAFQGGYYEIMSAKSRGAYKKDPDFTQTTTNGVTSAHLVTSMLKTGNCGRGERSGGYPPSGFLNKKGCTPDFQARTYLWYPIENPWPVIRLAELYLTLAEASVELNDLNTAKENLNIVRNRAGIPTVEDAWNGVATLDQKKMREIVRNERQVELYLENHNFWDMRRWLLGEKYFNVKHKGFNTEATTVEEYANVTEIVFNRVFRPEHYLLPIPIKDVNVNQKLVQNPGY